MVLSKLLLASFLYSGTKALTQPAADLPQFNDNGDFKLLYHLELPTANVKSWKTDGKVTYDIDNSAGFGACNNCRVGYYMQLDNKWVWTSFISKETDVKRLGVPVQVEPEDIKLDYAVEKLRVRSSTTVTNVADETNGDGKVEFWPNCYHTTDDDLPNLVQGNKYDTDDATTGVGLCYGSMQVHDLTGDKKDTVWAFNNFAAGVPEYGIGNQVGGSGHQDWTFTNNGASFETKILRVYISGGDKPTPAPTVLQRPETVTCYSVGDPHFVAFNKQRFDFQYVGEFTLWETKGLSIQVRQGFRLDMPHIQTVATNHAVSLQGSKTCGHKYEIYARNGGSMKVTKADDTVSNYHGAANVMNALQADECLDVAYNGGIAEFSFDIGRVRLQLAAYGLNLWIDAKGWAWGVDDEGICTQEEGWKTNLPCEKSLFTVYPNDDCEAFPFKPIKPTTTEGCNPTLLAQAREVCNDCPETISLKECLIEVCAIGNISAGEELMRACKIKVPIAPPKDVHCSSVGDPHFMYFDGSRRDFQSRGEYILYKTSKATVMVRHGFRPDIPNVATISTNWGVAIAGEWTCGATYELFRGDANTQSMTVTPQGGQGTTTKGSVAILAALRAAKCPKIAIAGNVVEFALGGVIRVRTQIHSWGINVWIDVKGSAYLASDSGICTKREGGFKPVPCKDSIFTQYPNTEGGCPNMPVIDIPNKPHPCSKELEAAAKKVCSRCPKAVDPTDCVTEVCAVGKIEAAEQLLEACKLVVPVAPLPTPAPIAKPDVSCVSAGDPHFRYFDNSGGDFQGRGEYLLYNGAGLRVQTRQAAYIGLAKTHAAYNRVSTNNALALVGSWACGMKIEAYATQDLNKAILIVDGKTTVGMSNILVAARAIQCKDMNVLAGGTSLQFVFTDKAYVKFCYASYGLNFHMVLKGPFYESSDSGLCTRRPGDRDPVDCKSSIMTVFPEGDCGAIIVDKTPEPLPPCNAAIEAEAKKICGKCTDVVAFEDCVFEACAVGTIDAAHKLLEACDVVVPLTPKPTPAPEPATHKPSVAPAPKPAVYCYSTGDPHFRFFNGVYADFQGRGEYTLYKTTGLNVQVRQGVYIGLPVTHVNYNRVSTNHGVVLHGDWTCGHKFEIYRTADNVEMIVTKQSGKVDRHQGSAAILKSIVKYNCPSIAVNSNIAEFNFVEPEVGNHGKMRFQIASYGINIWLDIAGASYLASDSGICTQRPGKYDPVPCKDSIFTTYPEDDCTKIVVNNTPKPVEPCPTDILTQAKAICNKCPGTINPEQCITEACATRSIEKAQELLKSCDLGKPIATPAPKPDVTCHSTGDPHFNAFDNVNFDFQARGEFTLWKTRGLDIQVRQGTWIGLSPTNPAFDRVSTNNAMTVTGEWMCGHKFEIYAREVIMVVTKPSGHVSTFTGLPQILAGVTQFKCFTAGVAGNVVEFNFDGKASFKWQVASYGLNLWLSVKGKNYLDSDTGICTRRVGWQAPVTCDDSIFTKYPDDDCKNVEVKDKLEPLPQCPAALKLAAQKICGKCPGVVTPEDCVFEACAKGSIAGAEGLLEACDLGKDIIKKPNCGGEPGRVKGGETGKAIRGVKKHLTDGVAADACECANACELAKGTEWLYNSKKGKCKCWKDAEKIKKSGNKGSKKIVGTLPGSKHA